MYEGGYSAVVDASKFFHQFPTHPEDQPDLGLKYPITGIYLFTYQGLPMGGAAFPGIAGQFGMLSQLCLLQETSNLFLGEARTNCWWIQFSETGFDPKLGPYELILHAMDGPAMKMQV
jgi:hypothetical protein